MPRKSKIEKVKKNSSVVTSYDPIGRGVVARVRKFGAATTSLENIVVLEWGDDTNGYEVIHAVNGYADSGVCGEYLGDGAKHFRVTQINDQTTDGQSIFWFDWLER